MNEATRDATRRSAEAFILGLLLVTSTAFLLACQPRVVVEAPKDPIVINMNVKIEHEVTIKVDKELEELFAEDEELF